jgi:hypothetical protein
VGLDTPRLTDIPPGKETAPRQDRRREARNRLLALSADLDDLGVHTRMVDPGQGPGDYPVTLRAWNPNEMGGSREVICVPDAFDKPRVWEFQYLLPIGVVIGDATDALNPGQAREAASKVKEDLGVKG